VPIGALVAPLSRTPACRPVIADGARAKPALLKDGTASGALARALVILLLCLAVLPGTGTAAVSGNPDIAALQVGLRRQKLYEGSVDGQLGVKTLEAIRALQERAGLMADGRPGRATRAALGRFGRRGPRILRRGAFGWKVARLQFQLAWHGFPSATMDGRFGEHLEGAVRDFQRWAGLTVDGRAGPEVFARLRTPPPKSPIALSPPLDVTPGDGFGPRRTRFHTGIDYSAPRGTPIAAAGAGVVTYAGELAGGWGRVITVAHGADVRTMYAHLSKIRVAVGQPVYAGDVIGRVGSSGNASGTHLHFEVRVRGAAVDPLTALH
jgi:peptidoglycan hydrolase-like protein with peptidoglycan-binding domain